MIGLLHDALRWLRAPSDPDGVAFDARYGTETRWFDLGNYEPIRPTVLDAALDALDIGVRDATFVDFGSGKGRAVLVAARRPFRRVIGIEHRPALHAIAERNAAAAARVEPPAAPVFLFCGDATQHPLPDGPIVAYLYNPFGADVVAAVLRRVARADARLVYIHPLEAEVVAAAGWRVVAGGGDAPWAWRVCAPPP